jgi:hypothetical protein
MRIAMRKIVLLVFTAVMLLGYSAKANSNVLEGQLVRQTLLGEDVKTLMSTDQDGQSLPLRIVYQKEALNTLQAFDPTQENLVIVKDVNIELVEGALVATVQLNVNGKLKVSKVYTKNGAKAPWNLSTI